MKITNPYWSQIRFSTIKHIIHLHTVFHCFGWFSTHRNNNSSQFFGLRKYTECFQSPHGILKYKIVLVKWKKYRLRWFLKILFQYLMIYEFEVNKYTQTDKDEAEKLFHWFELFTSSIDKKTQKGISESNKFCRGRFQFEATLDVW